MTDNNNQENQKTFVTPEEVMSIKSRADVERLKAAEDARRKYQVQNQDLSEQNAELIKKVTSLEVDNDQRNNAMTQMNAKIEALTSTLYNQKKSAVMSSKERQESESERLGRMATDIVEKRCQARYGRMNIVQ